MLKKPVWFVILSLLLILVTLSCIGCSIFNPIVGKWQEERTGQKLEFSYDGKVIVDTGGFVVTGQYELIGDEYIKVELEGLAGAFVSVFGADTWKYQIEGDLLTLEMMGKSSTFRRLK
ncbi:hypothetical protein ACFLTT_00165 [Chloroflexota bacterium]